MVQFPSADAIVPADFRRRAGASVVDGFFKSLSLLSRLDPRNNPANQPVEVTRDVPYRPTGNPAHRLDVFVPTDSPGPHPVVFYAHGGGFRILSKDTHFGMAMQFARRGYMVVNINYRLAPAAPFPAAVEDACAAYRWMCDNADAFDADLNQVVVAGESAGANLAAGLTIAAHYERPEPYAQQVYRTGVTPRVCAPACGILQVTGLARFTDQPRVHWFLGDRLAEVAHNYLRPAPPAADAAELDFVDPLCFFERHQTPDRALPAFFMPVGTGDILLDDTRRLSAALDAMGVANRACYYPGEMHAFHAFIWREQAKKCWDEQFEFLDHHLPAPPR